MRKGSPLRIAFEVVFRLILLSWKITGISVRDFARPQLCMYGSMEVSLPVYMAVSKCSLNIFMVSMRSMAVILLPM